MGVGLCWADGASLKSTCKLLREIESAMTFCCPGMCSAHISKSCTALKKWMHLSRCIRIVSLLDRAVISCTPAMLSQYTSTCCDGQRGPQMTQAAAIGTSSLPAMCWCSHSLSHTCCSYSSFQTAPHPHEPEASEENTTEGVQSGLWTSSML